MKGDRMLETSAVTPEYFSVVGMRLLRGRLLQASDGPGAPSVLLINEAAAKRYFAGRDPVGEVVTFRGPATIVGVVGSVHLDGPEHEPRPAMFVPLQQEPVLFERAIGTLAVRTSFDPRGLAETVREAIRPAIGGEPGRAQFLDDYFRRVTESRRFNAGVMAVFGVVAVLIGAIGVYGTMAFFVARQVRTIGVQMALGASPGLVMRGVLRTALTRVAVGVMIGLIVSAYMSSALQSFVFGVTPTDLRLYSAVAGFLGVVGFGAALLPAVRASRLDPLMALRED